MTLLLRFLLWVMKVITEDSQIRRKSNTSSIYLHIPFINYVFFLFQIRGAYVAVKNYYFNHKRLPNIGQTLVISFKFAFYGTIVSGIILLLLLLLGYNPFGHIASWYMNSLGTFLSGLLPIETAAYFFGELPQMMQSKAFTLTGLSYNLVFMLITYFIFAFLGGFLAYGNIKTDIKRLG